MTESLGPLALGVVYVAMMLTMAVSLARRTRQIAVDGQAAAAEQRFRRVNVLVPVLLGYAAAISLSAMTIESIPAFGDTLSGRGGFVWLPLMLVNFGVTFWDVPRRPKAVNAQSRLLRGRRFTETPHPTTRGRSAACYISTRATAIWVENRVGVGATLNMGNPRAWLLIIGIMLAPMIAARLLF